MISHDYIHVSSVNVVRFVCVESSYQTLVWLIWCFFFFYSSYGDVSQYMRYFSVVVEAIAYVDVHFVEVW